MCHSTHDRFALRVLPQHCSWAGYIALLSCEAAGASPTGETVEEEDEAGGGRRIAERGEGTQSEEMGCGGDKRRFRLTSS